MQLSKQLAMKIITEVKKVINEDVIVVGIDGIIMASTDAKRVNTFHEGAVITCQLQRRIEITQQDEKRLKGVKAGVNLPITFNNKVIGVIGITGNPYQVGPYGELLRRMTELLIQESYVNEQMDWRARSLEAYVFDWLKIQNWSNDFKNRGELLGIRLESNRRCVIVQIDQCERFMQRELWTSFHSYLDQRNTNDVIIRWGNDRFVLLLEAKLNEDKAGILKYFRLLQKYLFERFKFQCSIGIGDIVSSQNVKESYEQAERALNVAIKNRSIVIEEDLRFERCLQDITDKTKRDFITRTISPLLGENALLETLRVYIHSNQSLKESAKQLHIHINTLHYRLNSIYEITGLNPKQFHDLLVLYMAILFLDENTKNQR